MIRAVIFDYGGVLVDMRWDVARAIEAEHALVAGTIPRTLYSCDAWKRVEVGDYPRDAWLREAHEAIEQHAGRAMPPLHSQWRGEWGLIEPNIEIVRRLRERYRVSVLSNADYTLQDTMRERGIHSLFHDVVCSADVGLAKPDARVFALAAQRLGVDAGACVFVDDTEANVTAARDAGMAAVHFRVFQGDALVEQLAAVGVTI